MKMYLISDNKDTQTGMRLAGVQGVVVHDEQAFRAALSDVLKDSSVGILLITMKLSAMAPELISEIKLTRHTPLVVEIPDRHGMGKSDDFITHYVREAIGLKI